MFSKPFIVRNCKLCHKPMSHICSLSALGGKLFIRRSSSTCLSLICTISLMWFQTYSFTTCNFVSMCLAAHLTHYHRMKYFNGYFCCQPWSTPGIGSINHFVCPSASYHAIPYLCTTLMIIVLPFWSFSTQKLQVWKLATIVDFSTQFTNLSFQLSMRMIHLIPF
jgi:hypothetical protein